MSGRDHFYKYISCLTLFAVDHIFSLQTSALLPDRKEKLSLKLKLYRCVTKLMHGIPFPDRSEYSIPDHLQRSSPAYDDIKYYVANRMPSL